MLTRTLVVVAVLVSFCLAPSARAADPAPRRPNVVIILADDIGYGDLSCYGATALKTPNIDKLAAGGVRFTDGYAPSAVCTPSRWAMLTGVYAWRERAGRGILSGDAPLSMAADKPTVASLLKANGYATGLIGKWHLGLGAGPKADFNSDLKPGPIELGFDSAFFIPATVDRVPTVWIDGHRVAGWTADDPIRVDYQKKIGDEPTGKENPDLLKLKPSHGHDATIVNGISRIGWMTGGKAARWVDEEIADVINRRAAAFIEANKAKPFFLYVATHDVHVPRRPGPRFAGKSGLGARGDVVLEFDDTVGQVMAALEKAGVADDTLVMLSSDNGPVIDDGYQDEAVEKLGDHKVAGPLKGYKGALYEGGVRVPFIARWPAKIPAGRVSPEVVCLVDVPRIAAAAAGIEQPKAGFQDAQEMLPALTGQGKGRAFVVVHNGLTGLAIRTGNWKYVCTTAELLPGPAGRPAARATTGPAPKAACKPLPSGGSPRGGGYGAGPAAFPQLYDLSTDPAETKNVADEHPEIVRELSELLAKEKVGK